MPAPQCDDRPDQLHDTERPGALEETVRRRGETGRGEGHDEPGGPVLQRVEDEHGRDRGRPEGGQWIYWRGAVLAGSPTRWTSSPGTASRRRSASEARPTCSPR